jgi:translation initiation factor 1
MSRRDEPKPPPAFASPFAGLAGLRESLPSAPQQSAPAPKPAPEKKGPARAVVRREKKGRGGKEVTVVEHLGLNPRDLEVWLKDLKNKLGCGGVVEGDSLVLQGDQRDRTRALLEAKGVRKIIAG